eukprot:11163806-Lingulodinium_polyedra.AAC.1
MAAMMGVHVVAPLVAWENASPKSQQLLVARHGNPIGGMRRRDGRCQVWEHRAWPRRRRLLHQPLDGCHLVRGPPDPCQ